MNPIIKADRAIMEGADKAVLAIWNETGLRRILVLRSAAVVWIVCGGTWCVLDHGHLTILEWVLFGAVCLAQMSQEHQIRTQGPAAHNASKAVWRYLAWAVSWRLIFLGFALIDVAQVVTSWTPNHMSSLACGIAVCIYNILQDTFEPEGPRAPARFRQLAFSGASA